MVKKDEDKIIEEASELDDNVKGTKIYKNWATQVKEDSGNKCVICGIERKLEAHHLESFKNYPEKRLDPNNGVALCTWCHHAYHSYHDLDHTNALTLIQFMKKYR